jgi:hypothetical protein
MAQKRPFSTTENDHVWVQRISRSYGVKYWFNTDTGESVWDEPSAISSQEDQEIHHELLHQPSVAFSRDPNPFDFLAKEYAQVEINDDTCPRLIKSGINLSALVRKLHQSKVRQSSDGTYSTIFSIESDEIGMLTRAIQEDEILKTRLKKYDTKSKQVVDLPSFWEVWRENANFQRAIKTAADKYEIKWQLQAAYNYKLATTFMPDYAKAIYEHFQASTVLDPCSG